MEDADAADRLVEIELPGSRGTQGAGAMGRHVRCAALGPPMPATPEGTGGALRQDEAHTSADDAGLRPASHAPDVRQVRVGARRGVCGSYAG